MEVTPTILPDLEELGKSPSIPCPCLQAKTLIGVLITILAGVPVQTTL